MLRIYILVLFLVLREGSSFTIKYASYGIIVDISFTGLRKLLSTLSFSRVIYIYISQKDIEFVKCFSFMHELI